MERVAAPDAVTFEADIRDVQHCRTREGSVRLVLLGAKARNRGNHRRVRPPQTGSREASVVRSKHPRPVKFELLESLARTAAALSNAKASLRVKSKVAAPNEVVEFRAGAFLWGQSHKLVVKSGTSTNSRDGGTGRRSGLKIRRPSGLGGSTPPPGTSVIVSLSSISFF